MWHVAIFGDDLEALDGFGVANYIVEEDWAIFLDPDQTTLDSRWVLVRKMLPWKLIVCGRPIRLLDTVGIFR